MCFKANASLCGGFNNLRRLEEKYVYVARPEASAIPGAHETFNLGMTFMGVNQKAYVRTVVPGSPAAAAGVRPRDAVQFAFVMNPNRTYEADKMGGSYCAGAYNCLLDDWPEMGILSCLSAVDLFIEDERGERGEDSLVENTRDEIVSQYALNCEKKGVRTSYAEFCDLFPFDISQESSQVGDAGRLKQTKDDCGIDGTEHENSGQGPCDDLTALEEDEILDDNLSQWSETTHLKFLSSREKAVGKEMQDSGMLRLNASDSPSFHPIFIVFKRKRKKEKPMICRTCERFHFHTGALDSLIELSSVMFL